MQTTLIDRAQWRAALDRISEQVEGKRVHVEVFGDDLGDQFPLGDTSLRGLSYDVAADSVWIHTDRGSDQVAHPREIGTLADGARIRALEIESEDATWVLKFDEPPRITRE